MLLLTSIADLLTKGLSGTVFHENNSNLGVGISIFTSLRESMVNHVSIKFFLRRIRVNNMMVKFRELVVETSFSMYKIFVYKVCNIRIIQK